MDTSLLTEIIKFSGHTAFITVGILGIITSLITLILSKENKNFLSLILLLMLSLTSYLTVDLLLGIFGFTPHNNLTNIHQNITILINLSKLEILFLITSLMIFSFFLPMLYKNKLLKFLSWFFGICGVILIYLDIFSNNFFLNELKFYNFTYVAKEGPLYNLFLAYFGIVVIVEFTLLILFRNKILHQNVKKYDLIIYGILFIIISGVLEITEMLGITHLYPYSPSILGIGIFLLSINLLLFLSETFFELLISLIHKNKITQQIKKNLEDSQIVIQKSKEELTEILSKIEREISTSTNLPTITQQTVETIKEKSTTIKEKYENILSTFRIIHERIIDIFNYSNNEKIEQNTHEFIKNSNEIITLHKETSINIEEYQPINQKSKKLQSDLILSIDNSIEGFRDINLQFSKISELIEDIRIVGINLYIISSKIKESNISEILSEEIINKINQSQKINKDAQTITQYVVHLNKEIGDKKQDILNKYQLIEIKESINELNTKEIESKTNLISKNLEVLKDTSKQVLEITDKILQDLKRLQDIFITLSNFTTEFQVFQENYEYFFINLDSLSTLAKELYENLKNIEVT